MNEADFYIWRPDGLVWIGSVKSGGDPASIKRCATLDAYRKIPRVKSWPWSWPSSRHTRHSYLYRRGIWVSTYGRGWRRLSEWTPETDMSWVGPIIEFPIFQLRTAQTRVK